MRLSFRISIPAAIFTALALIFTALISGGEVDQEIFLGGYVYTPRNLHTEGGTAAYRLWFVPCEDESFSIIYPKPLTLGFEARGGYIWEPEHTWEASIMIDLKYEFNLNKDIAVYILAGTGGNYSGVEYESVATNYNFISRGGVGICIYRAIIQTAYEHRSNAGLEQPNRGVDLVTVSLGYRF